MKQEPIIRGIIYYHPETDDIYLRENDIDDNWICYAYDQIFNEIYEKKYYNGPHAHKILEDDGFIVIDYDAYDNKFKLIQAKVAKATDLSNIILRYAHEI